MKTEQALKNFRFMDHTTMYEICYIAHKVIYGYYGHHFARYNRPLLFDWWCKHFKWDEKRNTWQPLPRPVNDEV